MIKYAVKFFAAILIFVSTSGCLFSQLGGPLDDMVATPSVKAERLNKRLHTFHQALYWGSINEAANFVLPENKRKFVLGEKDNKRGQKLVDMEVESVIIDEDGETATVDVRIRYYRIPSYTIEVRNEVETWQFKRFNGGWFLKERSIEELGFENVNM